MQKLKFNLDKYKTNKRLAAHEWQDRAAKVIKEFKIPKAIDLKGKPLPLQTLVFQMFKRRRSQAESFYETSQGKETPGRYFCWLMLNRNNL